MGRLGAASGPVFSGGERKLTGPLEISSDRKARCADCPGRGCADCPMYGVGENPEYLTREKKKKEKRQAKMKAAQEEGTEKRRVDL